MLKYQLTIQRLAVADQATTGCLLPVRPRRLHCHASPLQAQCMAPPSLAWEFQHQGEEGSRRKEVGALPTLPGLQSIDRGRRYAPDWLPDLSQGISEKDPV